MRVRLSVVALAAAIAGVVGISAWSGGAAAPRLKQLRRQPAERHPGRHRARDRGRRLLLDGPGGAGAAARGLYHRPHLARVHAGAAGRHARQGGGDLFRMGRPLRPEDHHAVAADRRAGIGRRASPTRSRARPIGAPRAPRSRARCNSPSRCSMRPAINGMRRVIDVSGDGANNMRPAGHAGARRRARRPASPSTACRSCSSGRTRSRWISRTSTSTTRTASSADRARSSFRSSEREQFKEATRTKLVLEIAGRTPSAA